MSPRGQAAAKQGKAESFDTEGRVGCHGRGRRRLMGSPCIREEAKSRLEGSQTHGRADEKPSAPPLARVLPPPDCWSSHILGRVLRCTVSDIHFHRHQVKTTLEFDDRGVAHSCGPREVRSP